MHHVALDRPGPDDRHLDHQVVELRAASGAAAWTSAPGSPPGTRRRNRPCTACRRRPDPPPGCRPCRRCVGHGRSTSMVIARLMAVSMPSASTSTFIRPSVVDVVLVPLDEGAVLHRRVADRHGLVEPAAWSGRSRRRAGTGGAGKPSSSVGQVDGAADLRIGRDRARPGGCGRRARSSPQLPQTVSASAAVTSSVRPSALPTSRMALRGR